KTYAILNIVANIFYALFSTLSMLSLFPMMNVLFGDTERLDTKPKWTGMGQAIDYVEDSLNYFVTQKTNEGVDDVLIFMVILVVCMFMLKNLFNYLAMYFITY